MGEAGGGVGWGGEECGLGWRGVWDVWVACNGLWKERSGYCCMLFLRIVDLS